MALIKHLSLMSISVGARMVVGIVSLPIVARALGPESFGLLMLWLTTGSLLCILNNFGLGTYLLREVGRYPEKAAKLVSDAFIAKIILTIGVIVASVVVFPILLKCSWAIFPLIVGAMLGESFTEFFSVGLRASGHFKIDARVSIVSALIYGFGVGLAAWLTKSLFIVVMAYFITRSIVTLITWVQLSFVFQGIAPSSIKEGFNQIRLTKSYAYDSALSALFGQVDAVILNFYTNPVILGIFQAGMRFFMAFMQAAAVLTNVFLPRMATAKMKGIEDGHHENNISELFFLGTGVLVGLVFTYAGPQIVALLFGQKFEALKLLMPWFGLLYFVRMWAACWGNILTVDGKQHMRAIITAIHWLVIGLFSVYLVPFMGSVGWILALIIGTFFLAVAYAYVLARPIKFYIKNVAVAIFFFIFIGFKLNLP